MRRTFLVTLLLFVSALYVLANRFGTDELFASMLRWIPSSDQPSQEIAPQSSPSNTALISVLQVPPQQMRAALHDAYRLQPDKRFLIAVEEIHHFLSGKETKETIVEFNTNHWIVRHDGQEVGILPELPDLSQALELLTKWASVVDQHYPTCLPPRSSDTPQTPTLISQSIHTLKCQLPGRQKVSAPSQEQSADVNKLLDEFLAPRLATASRKINSLWQNGNRDAALLKAGMRALVLLNVQVLDRMETADRLAGKALALLALTKALTVENVAHEEALLAYTMGYSSHALRVSSTLPTLDPARLYVNADDQRLALLASGPEATTEAKYLRLLRLPWLEEDVGPFVQGVSTYFPFDWLSLPVMKAALDMRKFGADPLLSEALPRLVLLNLAQEVGMPALGDILRQAKSKPFSDEEIKALLNTMHVVLRAQSSTLIDHFESGLPILDRLYTGPFLDSQTYQAYYRSSFFSAFYILGEHYLDVLSSGEAAKQFASMLGEAKGGIAADFQRWYRNLVQSKSGQGDLPRLIEDLGQLQHFGAVPLMRTFDEQQKYLRYGDPQLFRATKLLKTHLDSRTSHRFELGNIAFSGLMDLRLTDQLFKSILTDAAPYQQPLQVWYAAVAGNEKLLKDLLKRADLRPEVKADALGQLEKLKALSDEELRKEYRTLIETKPDSFDLRRDYAQYLERVKAYEEGRLVAASWLARNINSMGLEPVLATARIARMYYLEGRYTEGLKTIGPVVESQQGWVMETAALLLEKSGQAAAAEQMSRYILKRYPDGRGGRTLLLELLWRHAKYAEAAEVLQSVSSAHPISPLDWRFDVGKRFAEVFGRGPKDQMLAAFSAMLRQGLKVEHAREFAEAMGNEGHHEYAFSMISQLPSEGLPNLPYVLAGYRHLKDWKDKTTALAWIRTKIPMSLLGYASVLSFEDKQDDLLWDFIENPFSVSMPDFIWALRAAASARVGNVSDPHRTQLTAYYGEHREPLNPAGQRWHIIGRFLSGLGTEEEVLALVTDDKSRCEVAYYLGLKAHGDGRYDDASDWYRISVETGLMKVGEYHWAFNSLYTWYEKGMTLPRLAQNKV